MKGLFFCVVLVTLFAFVSSFEHQNENERLVTTPFGLIPKGCVFHAREDEIVYFVDGILKIETPIYDDAGNILRTMIRLEKGAKCEFGKVIHSKDVHKGTPDVEPNGWAAYAKWLAGLSFNFFGGYWTVPAVPSQAGLQTLFLFTGFQNNYFFAQENGEAATVTSIIQPVLQWGSSEAGDEKYWAIASWFVAGENAIYSDLKGPLNTGDTIVGNMTIVTGATTKWTIETNDLTLGITTTLTAVTNVGEVDAFITLEVYGVSDCSEYPNGTDDFTNLYLEADGKEVTADWSPDTEVGCEEAVNIVSPTEVDIKF